jgi:hypothetical protein
MTLAEGSPLRVTKTVYRSSDHSFPLELCERTCSAPAKVCADPMAPRAMRRNNRLEVREPCTTDHSYPAKKRRGAAAILIVQGGADISMF